MPHPTVVAVYCPLWHPYDHASSWKGEGWCEWELLKTAPSRFPGHYQPLVPEWGYFDESDPAWTAREIDLAADHGIDVFLYDWYWYSGVKLMEEALERGFLAASNRHRLKFALMWANHQWWDYFPAPHNGTRNWLLPSRHSERDLTRVIAYCAEHYFNEPNYWRPGGRQFFSLFEPARLVRELGGPAATRAVFARLDQLLAVAGLGGMHWNAMLTAPAPAAELAAAGFRSLTNYNVVSSGKVSANYTEDYGDLIAAHRQHWTEMRAAALPYHPVVTMGWDVTARCDHGLPWPYPPQPHNGRRDYP